MLRRPLQTPVVRPGSARAAAGLVVAGGGLSPQVKLGAVSLGGERVPLGGLGRRVLVRADPRQLTASIPAPGGRLHLTVSTGDDDAVGLVYVDPPGGTRLVRHAGLATVNLRIRRRSLAIRGIRGAYEYGTSEDRPGITPRPLPEG